MKKMKNNSLVLTILFSAILVAGGLVYLGSQLSAGDLEGQIEKGIQAYVSQQQKAAAQPKIVEGDFADDDPFMGDETAPITLIEWSDYQCPFCRRFYNDTLPQLKAKYIDTGKVKLVYRDFPLNFHAGAKPAAIGAECAREQGGDGAYFAYHDLIFEGQNKQGAGTVDIPTEALKEYAVNLNLDASRFNECLDSQKYADEVNQDFAEGQKVGIRGTPGFLLNGRLISGAQPLAVFEAAIEEELNQ